MVAVEAVAVLLRLVHIAICYRLLQALNVLMEISLLFEYHLAQFAPQLREASPLKSSRMI
jgi:hypothetical protein